MTTKLKQTIMTRINDRMDRLQHWMESNYHLEHEDEVLELIRSVTPYWAHLSEEDQDYIHGCRYAIDEKIYWDVSYKDVPNPTPSEPVKISTDMKYKQVGDDWIKIEDE